MLELNKLLQNILIAIINFYQKYISPYKGYRCAHKVLYKGDSCSEYIKKSLLEQDLMKVVNLSKQRFCDCGEAAKILDGHRINSNQNSLSPVAVTKEHKTLPLLKRRTFIYLILPAAFTLGLATPVLAAKGRGYAKCLSIGSREAVREDQRDGKCGNQPELYYGLCCLGTLGAIFGANENK
ncbi:MAG: membrane protein insertion efficiency factor YidD [Crinalium sp.]